jgi:carboxyl-terminal processing protease
MGGRRQFVAIALVVVLAAAGAFVWGAIRPRGQAADMRAQGQSLLDATLREIRTKFILRSIDETKIYEGAGKGLLDVAGPACSRLISVSPLPPATDGRQRIAALVDEATQRCAAPRPDPQQLYFGAARGMLDSLGDQYTRFMDTRAFDEFKQDSQGFFFGIGIFIDLKNKQLIVVQPIPGTPAARAGLRAGDRITEIDGASTDGMALQEAVVRIRGPKGSSVHLTILRGDRPVPVTIVRDRIEIVAGEGTGSLDEATRARLDDAGIGYIKLVTFNENTELAFRRLFERAKQSGARALILDLRSNGGGLLDVSLRVADWFVPAGQPLVHTVDRDGRKETERATRRVKVEMPVVVLVNEFTASASEIVSGALQDHRVATLVGVKTFGKGVIQTIVDLPMGSGAAITTAKYLTPSGRDIHGKGLLPDEVVGDTEDAVRQRLRGQSDSAVDQQLERMRAAQLERAIEILKKKLSRGLHRLPTVPHAVVAPRATRHGLAAAA